MIYLDHAASSPILPEVYEKMLPWLSPDRAANPGSTHLRGRAARDAIEKARQQVAELINCSPNEIYFTSGGTESNNLCIRLMPRTRLAYSAAEHPSVAVPCAMYGKRQKKINVEKDGCVKMDEIETLLYRRKPYNLSLMYVNNETGSVNPIREIGKMCVEADTFLHVDGVQAAGHEYINVSKDNIDMLSISGHKMGAPQGIGAAYISRRVMEQTDCLPIFFGGGQEQNIRSGTENVFGIAALGEAAEIAYRSLRRWRYCWAHFRDLFISILTDNISDGFVINGGNYCSNIISLTIPGVSGDALCRMLDIRGIYISTGAACSSGSSAPSPTLLAMGLSATDAACTVRISMGYNTTAEDMTAAAKAIADCASTIKTTHGPSL